MTMKSAKEMKVAGHPIETTRLGRASRRIRLQTIVWLRWLAVAGQSATILLVAFGLNFPLPLLACSLLIGALALANLFLTARFPSTYRLEPWEATLLLAFDLLQLTALIYITGGLSNPFAPLICVQVIIAFASQPLRHSLILLAFAVICSTAIAFSPFPVPWYPGEVLPIQLLLHVGTWVAIIATTSFAAFYAYRVSHEANQAGRCAGCDRTGAGAGKTSLAARRSGRRCGTRAGHAAGDNQRRRQGNGTGTRK